MKNILLAKEMPLYSKNTITLNKEFRTRDSLFNMDFCSRIIKQYLEFSRYDELFANMIFLDMYKNGSNSVDIIHDKEVLFFQSVLVHQTVNQVMRYTKLYRSAPIKYISTIDIKEQETVYWNNQINIIKEQGKKLHQSHIIQNCMINRLLEKESGISDKFRNQLRVKRIGEKIQYQGSTIKHTIGYINWYHHKWVRQIQERRIIHQSIQKNHVIEYTEKYQGTPIKCINITHIEKQSGTYWDNWIDFNTKSENLHQANQINNIVRQKSLYQSIQNYIINQLLKKGNRIPETRQSQVRLQKTEEKISAQGVLEIREVYWNSAAFLKHIFQKQMINLLTEKKELLQEDTVNFVTEEKIQYQDNQYQANQIRHIIGYANWYQGKRIKQIQARGNIYQRSIRQSRLIFHAIHQENQVQAKNYTQPENHIQANIIAGFYKRSSMIQNRIINQLLEKENRIFQKQMINLLTEKKELLQENTVNFVTDEKIQYQNNKYQNKKYQNKKYQDNKIKHIIGYANWYQGERVRQIQARRNIHQRVQISHAIEYTKQYRSTPIKYIGITHLEEQSGTYWNAQTNIKEQSEKLHQVNQINYIEKQKRLHQSIQKRIINQLPEKESGIFQKQIINLLTKKRKLLQENTVNFVTDEKKQYQDNQYQDNKIKLIIGYTNWYQGGRISPIQARRNIYQRNIHQVNQINCITKQKSLYQSIQNRIINQLLKKQNEIPDKRQNQVLIQETKENILAQGVLKSREVFWPFAAFLKNIFQKQLINPLSKEKELYQENTVNFVTDEKIQYQDNQYQDNKIKYIIGYTNRYRSVSIKYINITHIGEQSSTYWNDQININEQSKKLHQVNQINYIAKQKSLHQIMQSRFLFHIIENSSEFPIIQKYYRTAAEKNYAAKATHHRQRVLLCQTLFYAIQQENQIQANAIARLYEKSGMIQNCIINQLLETENRISDARQNQVRIQQMEEKELYQENIVNFVAAEKSQYQVNQLNAISTTFRKDFYKNNVIVSVPNNKFDLWGTNQTVLKSAAGLEQTIEKENYYSRDRVYAEKNNVNEKKLSEIQCQVENAIEGLQKDLTEERQKNISGQKILKTLEERVQQQEEQIKELKIMCKEFHKQEEENKDNQARKEKYLEVFNNDLKLERMRYGIL